MPRKRNVTIEDLVVMVNRGFSDMEIRTATKEDLAVLEKRIATKEELRQLGERLEKKMDVNFFAVNSRLDLIHEDISDLPAVREELRHLIVRVDRLERKTGTRK